MQARAAGHAALVGEVDLGVHLVRARDVGEHQLGAAEHRELAAVELAPGQVEEPLAALAVHGRATEVALVVQFDDPHVGLPPGLGCIAGDEPFRTRAHLQADVDVAIGAAVASRQFVPGDDDSHDPDIRRRTAGGKVAGLAIARAAVTGAGTIAGMHLATTDGGNDLLEHDPLALLIGMLLDQQIPMEKAFTSPSVLRERLGRDLDATEIAGYDPAAFETLFRTPPALHRFPAAMAKRVQALAQMLVDQFDGRAENVWTRRGRRRRPGQAHRPAARLRRRRRRGSSPRCSASSSACGRAGWREAAGAYGEQGSFRSVADVVDDASLQKVRTFKKQTKAAAKAEAAGTGLTRSGEREGAGAHRVDLAREGVDQRVGDGRAAAREPVGHHPVTALGQHRLRVELHAVDRQRLRAAAPSRRPDAVRAGHHDLGRQRRPRSTASEW